jgi:hypothetical protein
LANGLGDPNTQPEATEETIQFNGSEAQPKGKWTTNEELSIPWPSNNADLVEPDETSLSSKTDGNWFAGHLISQRCAPLNNLTQVGSGSYETCSIYRVEKQEEWRKDDKLIFNFCKTAYRPYDLTVTAVLIALKHHFPESEVSSDGEAQNWLDGRFVCQQLFGWGLDEKIGD